MPDPGLLFQTILRWTHFVAGITWIGLLYFFNLVNVNFMKSLDAPTKGKVVPQLMPRALWWFRHSAWVTVLAGLLMLMKLWPGPSAWWQWSISLGTLIGLVMLFNVWVIIWPNQKRVIQMTSDAAAKQQPAPPEMAALARRAFLASRTNFVLSFFLLFFMAAAAHLPWF